MLKLAVRNTKKLLREKSKEENVRIVRLMVAVTMVTVHSDLASIRMQKVVNNVLTVHV